MGGGREKEDEILGFGTLIEYMQSLVHAATLTFFYCYFSHYSPKCFPPSHTSNPPHTQRALGKRKISFLFGDYVRFPPAYFRPAYSAVARTLLKRLRRSGLLAPECRVYPPYLNVYDGVEDVFEGIMADKSLAPTLVSEKENPLYQATRTLFDEDHVHKCEGLMRDAPFLRLTIKSTEK